AGVMDGSTWAIYLDGVLTESRTLPGAFVNNTRDLYIGRAWDGGTPTRYFHGSIDDPALYSRGLSAAEVGAIYKAGGPAKGGAIVQGNLIGTNATGTAAIANGGNGVTITDSAGNLIGDSTAATRNIISGNTGSGVLLTGGTTTHNLVQGNYIGLDTT